MYKKNKLILFLILLIIFFNLILILNSCDSPINSSDVLNSIYPNFTIFIIHIVSSLIIIVLAIWLVWSPTKKMIESRRQLASKNILDSENAKKEAYERLIEAEQKRLDAYQQAQYIIDNASKAAISEHDNILSRAQNAADAIIKKAKNDIDSLQNSVYENANRKIVDLTYHTVKMILEKEIDHTKNDKLINDFIKKFDDDTLTGGERE